ncbi:MAG: NADH-quinone oxidoreductase subunit M [Alphaproteobacteria bacterium]|nr:NADH-quinone oxidoreductase subunit M [Alphaproteobacteria bacterium]
MLEAIPLLSLLNAAPFLGFFAVFLFDDRHAKRVALFFAGLTAALALMVLAGFDPAGAPFQFVEKVPWITALGLSYHKGIDGISLWFVMLTVFLTPVAMMAGFAVKERTRLFMGLFLLLEAMILGVFTTLDLFLFYVFFEGVLIPMFFIIGLWGGEQRFYAAMKFFLYTFLGSVLMLLAVFVMILKTGSGDMTAMMGFAFPKELALFLWMGFFASFAIKTPMWPFHTWLPLAHVQAPTAGSVILAALLLKMGGYGFIRISLQMLPQASQVFAPLMIILSLVAIIYASLVALAQVDMKKLVAYSSVAHMGFMTLGIFSGTREGLEGAMMVMISHALVSAALFLGVGVLYERTHTRQIEAYGGVAQVMPHFAALMMVFFLAALGLPGTSGFVGEFLSLQGAWLYDGFVAFIAALGVILSASYMLWLYKRVFFGAVEKPLVRGLTDLGAREYVMLVPLMLFVLGMGLYPSFVRDVFAPSLMRVMEVWG